MQQVYLALPVLSGIWLILCFQLIDNFGNEGVEGAKSKL